MVKGVFLPEIFPFLILKYSPSALSLRQIKEHDGRAAYKVFTGIGF